MESADSVKAPKPSNISDMVLKFAKVCKIRSIGVFDTHESKDHDQVYPMISTNIGNVLDGENKNVNEDAAHLVQKKRNLCGHEEILKLFETLLDLKLAYVKLQEAHVPYNPEKIRTADEEVASQIDTLCRTKRTYKEKLLKGAESGSACLTLLLAEIKVKETALEKLKSQARNKENMVNNLRRGLWELETKNKMLAEEIWEKERECFRCLNHGSFEGIVKTVGKAIHDFAKPLIALMKLSDWNLDKAADAIQASVVYAKRSHKKYAFEAYVAQRMFHGFTPQTCFLENVMKSTDPIVALMEDPQSSFAEFCRAKYLSVIHPEMEMSFFGNLDHRNFVANSIHPHTPFYRAFVAMARWVWYLQGFGSFIEPTAEIFGVEQGSQFSDVHMEVVEELKEYKSILDRSQERCKVEFMVMPGFKVGETLVRSRVYVSEG